MKELVSDYVQEVKQADSLGDVLKQMYHVPVLLALIVFMLASRLRALENFQTDSGVTFRGNDAWYHFRQTNYLIENFPTVMPFDTMTNYPTGKNVDQFGTLFDQIVSGFILLTSLGDPSTEYAGLVMLVAAPVFVVATIIPVYLIVARFAGRWPALVGAAVFALLPGSILRPYGVVGFYDHHAPEVFFQTLGVLGFVTAIAVAQQTQPVWELVVDRDLDTLRRPLLYSVGAGIAAALYMWAWPPGVLLIGFTGIFFAIKITADVYHDQTPEPTAFVGAVSMITSGLFMLVPISNLGISSVTNHSPLQVILPFGVGVGCIFLAYLAREWETRELDRSWYPIAVGSLIFVSAALFSRFVVNLFSSLLLRIGFSTTATTQTVGEATPPLASGRYSSIFDFAYSEYRLTLFTAIAAAIIILARPLVKSDSTRETGYVAGALSTVGLIYLASPVVDQIAGLFGTSWQLLGLFICAGLIVGATLLHRYEGIELYVIVWAGFITAAAFTQSRFTLYLAVVVTVFTAIFVSQAAEILDIRATADSVQESARNLEGWQIIAGVTIVFLVVAPFMFPTVVAWDATSPDSNGPGAVQIWENSLEWMNDETPAPGTLGGADNEMSPYGTYDRPADGDYPYPEGAYGVQSWWDYGHWITVHGERIPNANPFQDGATEAANYLLAPNETAAAGALEQQMDDSDETRYVMLDWKLAEPSSRKYLAPARFNDNVSAGELVDPGVIDTDQYGRQQITLPTQRHHESLRVRLYSFHGSATDPRPIVANTRTAQTESGRQFQVIDQSTIKTYDTLDEAQEFIDENPDATLVGIGDNPRERVDALEQYRLVHTSQTSASRSGRYNGNIRRTTQLTGLSVNQLFRTSPSWIKTFEKVPGATIEGSGAPSGAEVRATVPMENPAIGQRFGYTQYATADESGNFEMTVPYSTTGYENFGPENGYTNVSVRAAGEYQFRTTSGQYTSSATVTESQVVGVADEPVQVQLTETEEGESSRETIEIGG